VGDGAVTVKYVYDIGEGSKEMRDLLGGKGANVAEMTRILGPERVPAGFTITTEACVTYMQSGRELPDGMDEQVDEALERLEQLAGKQLGDSDDPLLVSVRSGARESMCRCSATSCAASPASASRRRSPPRRSAPA
jgi:pyruvate,orthophosphate dikinase